MRGRVACLAKKSEGWTVDATLDHVGIASHQGFRKQRCGSKASSVGSLPVLPCLPYSSNMDCELVVGSRTHGSCSMRAMANITNISEDRCFNVLTSRQAYVIDKLWFSLLLLLVSVLTAAFHFRYRHLQCFEHKGQRTKSKFVNNQVDGQPMHHSS